MRTASGAPGGGSTRGQSKLVRYCKTGRIVLETSLETAVLLSVAYLLGLFASAVRLPPLVGYLGGGFALFAFGFESTELLHEIGHAGVLLLLFTIGLHLRLKSILRPEVLGVGAIHIAISAALFTLVGLAFGLGLTAAALVAVILGFSSTVLAAKTLEERGELDSYHGRVAIGILIFQDIVAIALLAFSGLGTPSPWALTLLALPLARVPLTRLMAASKHDELLLLYGLLLALGAGALFEAVGLSSELGALVFGALLAGTPQADELSDKLWALKEAFLVGFFLEIGLGGLPTPGGAVFALALLVLLPAKSILFFFLAVAFNLRVRNGFMVAVSLTAYSEFALIAGAAAVVGGLIPESSLVVLALAVVLSFAVSAPLNRAVHKLYARFEPMLVRFEREVDHPDGVPRILGSARSLVFGMGRTGKSAYATLNDHGGRPVGLDSDPTKLEQHREEGRRVVYGDAEDPDLWDSLNLEKLERVVLTLPDIEARLQAVDELRGRGFEGIISTLSMYPDEEEPLRAAGADIIAHPLSEAGYGLAEQSLQSPTTR
ncbi:MAG: cation:proton antiporter family protein [Rubrobacteraceae bacterium]